MKKLIILLLVFGLVFSATAFPNEIKSAELELDGSSGNLENGEAYYVNEDNSIIAAVVTESMSESTWEETAGEYSMNGWNIKTESGLDYYYACESGYNEDYDSDISLCLVDTYHEGIHYMMDVAVFESGETSKALGIGIKIGKELTGEDSLFGLQCPVALLLVGFAGFIRIYSS